MPRRAPALGYGVAGFVVLAATLVHAELLFAWQPRLLTFCAAVVIAAWVGGRGPALAATVLSTMVWLGLWSGYFSSAMPPVRPDPAALAVFFSCGVGIATLSGFADHSRVTSERSAATARLALDRLGLALSSARAGLWEYDLENGRAYWSKECWRLCGISPSVTPSWDSWLSCIHPDDRERCAAEIRALKSNPRHQTFELEFRVDHPKLGIRWLRDSGRTYRDSSGIVVGARGITLDVTSHVAARDALKTSENRLRIASQTKDEFIAMLSHELRNPLGAIVGALELVDDPGVDPSTKGRARDVMQRQVGHVRRMLDDLLDVTRAETGRIHLRRGPVSLQAVVEGSMKPILLLPSHMCHAFEVRVTDVWVEGDATRLEQVVTNLIGNARKYTPVGRSIRLLLTRQAGEAVLVVEDEGIGIGLELLPRIFEPFVQGERGLERTEGGLGIGLTLVKRLVTLHAGSVEARSAGPGHGSCFTVRLPAIEPPGPDCRQTEPKEAILPRRILVVEDQPDSREMLKALLELQGHEVREAGTGRAAIHEALIWSPEIVLLDLGLPELDGYAVARAIRRKGGRMKLVALTGYGQADDHRRSREAGFDAHLVKPVDFDHLATIITA